MLTKIHALEAFREAVRTADPDLLMMSRMDCHAPGLASIVIDRSNDGGLVRAFLAHPGHPMSRNTLDQDMPLGIHNHRYPLQLRWLNGRVSNDIYTVSKEKLATPMNCFRFTSGEMVGPPTVESLGKRSVTLAASNVLVPGCDFLMPSSTLHTVCCDDWAAWLVIEGTVDQTTTTLFSFQEEIDTSALYNRFVDHSYVISYVDYFVRGALKNTVNPYV